MGIGDDLAEGVLAAELPDRRLRSYPAVLSTESVALAWARDGAPHGSVVTAGYQVSPRGRGGLPWTVDSGRDLCFSLVLRPELPAAREGWIYAVAVCALADLREGSAIAWPDEIHTARGRAGAVGAWAELGPSGVQWLVLTVLLQDVGVPRAAELGRAVRAIEHRLVADTDEVLADYRPRCDTLGRRVCARMIPLGPAGPRVEGTATDVLADGSLAIRTDRGNRVAVRPQNLGVLDILAPGRLSTDTAEGA